MSDSNDNVRQLKVIAKDQEAELIAAIEQMAERAEPIAKLRWAFYQAHLAQGFTPDQAIILCQKVLL